MSASVAEGRGDHLEVDGGVLDPLEGEAVLHDAPQPLVAVHGRALLQESPRGGHATLGKDVVPGDPAPDGGEVLHSGRVGSAGEPRAVDGADRGAVHGVGGDAPGHQCLQHAHLGCPPCPAPGEDERRPGPASQESDPSPPRYPAPARAAGGEDPTGKLAGAAQWQLLVVGPVTGARSGPGRYLVLRGRLERRGGGGRGLGGPGAGALRCGPSGPSRPVAGPRGLAHAHRWLPSGSWWGGVSCWAVAAVGSEGSGGSVSWSPSSMARSIRAARARRSWRMAQRTARAAMSAMATTKKLNPATKTVFTVSPACVRLCGGQPPSGA